MSLRAPDFWWRREAWQGAALAPAGWLYAQAARCRQRHASPQAIAQPVLCVGNLVAGGAGKTPTALALAERLTALGLRPAFLTRGYGGRLAGPLWVDPAQHTATEVGDEPLLLARRAPTVVARDRVAGALMAAGRGDVLVMDDGFQNPSLTKTFSFLVVDGGRGFGNGRVLPAGPLREPVADGLARAGAVVLIGEDRCGVTAAVGGLPLLRARLEPLSQELAGERVLAFAGIGRPEKFFETLRALGAELVEACAFPDHHAYSGEELTLLRHAATRADARLVTTEKDLVRIAPVAREGLESLAVRLAFEDREALDGVLRGVLRLA